VEVWQTANLRPLRLREEEKKKERRKKPHGKNIMACPIPYRATIRKKKKDINHRGKI